MKNSTEVNHDTDCTKCQLLRIMSENKCTDPKTRSNFFVIYVNESCRTTAGFLMS